MFMFSKRLKILRQEKKISQVELGKVLSLSKQTISSYENGGSYPNPETLSTLADYFDVSTDYLLGRTEFNNTYKLEAKDLPQEVRQAGIEYLEVDEYTKKYGLSKDQIKDLLEQVLEMTSKVNHNKKD